MMKNLREAISQAIGFSKTEARGSLLLIFLIFVSILLSRIYISYLKTNTGPESHEVSVLSDWTQEVEASFSEKESASIRESGVFTRDIQKADKAPTKLEENAGILKAGEEIIPKEEKEIIAPLDLNSVDSEELQRAKGIGPVFADRIIKFRNSLGGFSSDSQLMEVYGIPPESLPELTKYFKVQSSPQPIDINNDSAKVLARHPYISYDLAWIIINYRKQHGDITSSMDLKKIQALDSQTLARLKPYID